MVYTVYAAQPDESSVFCQRDNVTIVMTRRRTSFKSVVFFIIIFIFISFCVHQGLWRNNNSRIYTYVCIYGLYMYIMAFIIFENARRRGGFLSDRQITRQFNHVKYLIQIYIYIYNINEYSRLQDHVRVHLS